MDISSLTPDSLYSMLSPQNLRQHIIAINPLPALLKAKTSCLSLGDVVSLFVINYDPHLSPNACVQLVDEFEYSTA